MLSKEHDRAFQHARPYVLFRKKAEKIARPVHF